MRTLPICALIGVLVFSGCTQVTDLYLNETLDSTPTDVPQGDADANVGETNDTGGPEVVDELCIPDPCAAKNQVCISGICGDCIAGYAPNALTGICEVNEDPCIPDPCAEEKRLCINGSCAGCIDGFVSEGSVCVPSGDPCSPDPCASAHKNCISGICDGCVAGYFEQDGQCVLPNVCIPNPCTEQYKTQCTNDVDGSAVCLCDQNAHDDGLGGCTFDPCVPDPCSDEPLFTRCTSISTFSDCTCPIGQIEEASGCVPDPCMPNPCAGQANICSFDGIAVTCSCPLGFEDDGAGVCIESWAGNPDPALYTDVVQVDLELDGSMQLFLDDFGLDPPPATNNIRRRLHKATRASQAYDIDSELATASIGRARGGSIIEVPQAFREGLDEADPLKPWAWRQYYIGFRQIFSGDLEYGWLCVAVADTPVGPWIKPQLDTELAAPNCVLTDEAMLRAEVTLEETGFSASVVRAGVGTSAADPGVYVYTSANGINWAATGGAVVALNDTPIGQEKYGRVSVNTRLVKDTWTGGWIALAGLTSLDRDARGVMFNNNALVSGWTKQPNVTTAPAILGPTLAEISLSRSYGDMVAWREGAQWIGLLEKRLKNCPKTKHVSAVTSRDGVFWEVVTDDVDGSDEFITSSLSGIDASVDSLVGGKPPVANGQWQIYTGGLSETICDNTSASGGLYRNTVRVGGIASLEQADTSSPGIILTKPMRMKPGVVGAAISLNATVSGKLTVVVEKLTPIDTLVKAVEKVVSAGDYVDEVLVMDSLVSFTDDRFRLRFIMENGVEVFGFRIGDPACNPNPCTTDPEKGLCVSAGGSFTCDCSPPLHPDGEGGCTDDPCIPDPCFGANESGCEALAGEAVCGCVDGFVRFDGACIPDPCVPNPCAGMESNKCRTTAGVSDCYCPAGSVPSSTGCIEAPGTLRAFVGQLAVDGIGASPEAADGACANQAVGAGLPGTYRAWVSTGALPAKDRFAGAGPWRTYDFEANLWTRTVATNAADLSDGSLENPINATPIGTPVSGSCTVWTGTAPTGVAPPPFGPFGGTCQDWTTANPGATGLAGDCQATDAAWTAAGPVPCSQPAFLYCLQVPELVAGP